jgi:hypothetical protein
MPSPRPRSGGVCSRPTSRARRRERPGGNPVFQNIGANSAAPKLLHRSLPGSWTDSKPGLRFCARTQWLSSVASVPSSGAGDGLQPPQTSRLLRSLPHALFPVGFGDVALAGLAPARVGMSYRTIAAALALEDVSIGERLVAFSLASFADAEHQTFVGNPAAAARAGLSRSQYLAAREQLEARGWVSVAAPGGGRGRSSTLTLGFAVRGPWREERINPQLFGAVLGYSRARGAARVLLATLAAVANDDREVLGLTTEEVRAAAGLSDRTYRRARATLLASGELVAESCVGGRGNTNRWRLGDPRCLGMPVPARQRVAPARNARPLLGTVAPAEQRVENPGQNRTVSALNPGQDRTLSGVNPGQNRTLSGVNPGQNRTLLPLNPGQSRTVSLETPAETPAPNARAGREPGNQKNNYPPNPPEGGSPAGSVTIVEDFLSDRGRTRQRTVVVELDAIRQQLGPATEADRADWHRIRGELRRLVGESTFEIWLAQVELAATGPAGCLLLTAPAATRGWVADRFTRAFDQAGGAVKRGVRLAGERELRLLDALAASPSLAAALEADPLPDLSDPIPHQEAV